MNVDENAAMMNADEINATEAPANEEAAPPSSNQSSDEAAPAKPTAIATNDGEQANATETDQVIEPDEPMTGNQSDGNEDEPNDQY